MVCLPYPFGKAAGGGLYPLVRQIYSFFSFFSSSTRFLSSSMAWFAGVFVGLLNESFNADIQRELPPRVALRAMAYTTKLAPTISRMMINNPMAALSKCILIPVQ